MLGVLPRFSPSEVRYLFPQMLGCLLLMGHNSNSPGFVRGLKEGHTPLHEQPTSNAWLLCGCKGFSMGQSMALPGALITTATSSTLPSAQSSFPRSLTKLPTKLSACKSVPMFSGEPDLRQRVWQRCLDVPHSAFSLSSFVTWLMMYPCNQSLHHYYLS